MILAAIALLVLGVALVGYVARQVYGSLPGGTVAGLGHLYRGANFWLVLAGMIAIAGGLALLIDLLPASWQFWLGGAD
ncbi:MAG TPA: hypothetical protein VNB06_14595 [Thermoanaerobaculia bacterium]|nr:hypothetical protein [Thermoanaerobaculia bacterium]